MQSVARYSPCLKRNTVLNRSYLARALVMAASMLLPIAGYGDTGTHGPASAWVYVGVCASLIADATASARWLVVS
jgi:hypothetical protein